MLKEWVELRKKICALVEPSKPAYDVCIDRFERGMTAARFDEIFAQVRLFLHCIVVVALTAATRR